MVADLVDPRAVDRMTMDYPVVLLAGPTTSRIVRGPVGRRPPEVRADDSAARALVDAFDLISRGWGIEDDDDETLWIERAGHDVSGELRNPKGTVGGGRFRSLASRIADALEGWKKGNGPDDPLAEFSQPQLRTAAVQLGLNPPKGMKAAPLKELLLAHAHDTFRQALEEKQKRRAGAKFSINGPDGHKIDVAVYTGADPNKPTLREITSANRPGRVVTSQPDLAGLEKWATDNGHTDVAQWAASERARAEAKSAPKATGAATGEAALRAAAVDLRSASERKAYADYVSQYRGVNGALRDGKGEIPAGREFARDRATVAGLDSAMKRSGLPRDVEVYRVGGTAEFPAGRPTVGAEWTDHGFTSTSTTVKTDLRPGETQMRISVPAGTRAVSTSELDANEILLDRGSRFRVTKVDGPDAHGNWHVEAEVVGTRESAPKAPAKKAATRAAKAAPKVDHSPLSPDDRAHHIVSDASLTDRQKRTRLKSMGLAQDDIDRLVPTKAAAAKRVPKAAKAAPKATVGETTAKLASVSTRKEGREALDGLSVTDLKAVAKDLQVDSAGANKAQLAERIVEATVGVRADARGIKSLVEHGRTPLENPSAPHPDGLDSTPRAPHLRTTEPPVTSSSTHIVPTPTPPNPQSPWGKVRDRPTMTWSETHGRPGPLDQVDRVYTAPTREDARKFLASMDDTRLQDVADQVEDIINVKGLTAERNRDALITRLVDGIREPEGIIKDPTPRALPKAAKAAAKKATPYAPHPDGLDAYEGPRLKSYAAEFLDSTSGMNDAQLRAALRTQGVGSPDVEQAKRIAEAAKVPEVPTSRAELSLDPVVRKVQIENRVRAAYTAVLDRNGRTGSNLVGLADLRQEIGSDITRDELDHALIEMTRWDGQGTRPPVLIVPENNQKALRPVDREAALSIGNQNRHLIRIDDPTPRPLPAGGARPKGEGRSLATDYGARRAALAGPHPGEPTVKPLEGGISSRVELLTYPDGTRVVRKDYSRGPHAKAPGETTISSRLDADSEEMAARVLDAVGLPTPAVHRHDENTVDMEFVNGTQGGVSGELKAPRAVVDSEQGRLLGLADAILGHRDRNGGGWMRTDGGIVPIDNGNSFGTGMLAAHGNPFVRHLMTSSGWASDSGFSATQLADIRRRLEALRPEFDRIGRPRWYQEMMGRLDEIERRASGPSAIRSSAPGEPHHYKHGWIPIDPLEDLKAAVASGELGSDRLGGGRMAQTRHVYYRNGTDGVEKKLGDVSDVMGPGYDAARQADAEERASQLGQAIDAPVVRVLRTAPDQIVMDVADGISAGKIRQRLTAAATTPEERASVRERELEEISQASSSVEGIRLGTFDVLTGNWDRQLDSNWNLTDNGTPVGYDHSFAFDGLDSGDFEANTPGSASDPPQAHSIGPFTAHFVRILPGGRTEWDSNPLSPDDIAWLRQRLASLEGDWTAAGRHDWWQFASDRLEAIAPHATATTSRFAT